MQAAANIWIPVAAALLGALVGGAISAFITWRQRQWDRRAEERHEERLRNDAAADAVAITLSAIRRVTWASELIEGLGHTTSLEVNERALEALDEAARRLAKAMVHHHAESVRAAAERAFHHTEELSADITELVAMLAVRAENDGFEDFWVHLKSKRRNVRYHTRQLEAEVEELNQQVRSGTHRSHRDELSPVGQWRRVVTKVKEFTKGT